MYQLCKKYLSNNPQYPSAQISKLKTRRDHSMDVWRTIKSPIINLIKSISAKHGAEIDLIANPFTPGLESTHIENLKILVNYLMKIGYVNIYILVDKIDEQSLTGNDPEAGFELIKDLLLNLTLVELPNVCYKFFLWDAFKEFLNIYGRPDRVSICDIRWSKKKLHEMLDRRVSTYSENKINTIEEILEI